MNVQTNEITFCPICDKSFSNNEIEKHVNKCLFLNCPDDQQKRKRSPSPVLQSVHCGKVDSKRKSPQTVSVLKEVPGNSKNVAPLFQQNARGSTEKIQEGNDKVSLKNNRNCSMAFNVPLAKQVQPKSLDDFYGQNKILGKSTVLRSLIEKQEIPNMILWGPPGCGKTSLAGVICEMCKKTPKKFKFVTLSATNCGVKEVQNIITIAQNDIRFGRKTIIFMDEIHRFNKRQQDTFLLSVEKGDITLIGATTENPSFSLNSALLSRCRVVVLEKLGPSELYSILERAAEAFEVDVVDVNNPCGVIKDNTGMAIEESALQWLADISDGDARIALSNLQLVIQNSSNNGKIINLEDIKEGIKKSHMLYDRAGEEHYNIISAMHKSIRASDDNAALYWTTRMIVSGEDPRYVARRLVRAASEDIGNADPTALSLAISTMQGCQLLGMPEADVLLAQCAIYLARAPKSREADKALGNAKQLITECKGVQPPVPMHLRNAPTRLMKDLGYGKVADGEDYTCMPPELKNVDFFK